MFLRKLKCVRFENCTSMTSFLSQIIGTSYNLIDMGFNVNDKWLGALLLTGLFEKYSPMIMASEYSYMLADLIKAQLLDMK